MSVPSSCSFGLPCPDSDDDVKTETDFDRVGTGNRFDSLKLERRGITSHLKQDQFWQKETLWRDSIVSKLKEVGAENLTHEIDSCHRDRSVRQCCGCKTYRVFWNRCELKWCPICAERLARERRETVETWSKQIKQAKHVVLTVRNTHSLSKQYFQWFKLKFANLRRSKFASNWVGGFYSIETTWDSKGAHVHLHALVNARWIDARELSLVWGKLVGQDFAIVKVRDAREKSYLSEVAKYVVKGSELASWDGLKLKTFVESIEGVRMFGVFGNLYKLRREIRDWLDWVHEQRNVCECGCRNFRVLDERCFEFEEISRELEGAIPPPLPRTTPHPELQFA